MLSRVVIFLLACELALSAEAVERPKTIPAERMLLPQTERSELPAIQAIDVALRAALVTGLDRPMLATWRALLNPLRLRLAASWQERRGFILVIFAVVAVQSALIAVLLGQGMAVLASK